MLKNLKADNIYIVCGHTDMRKSIDGLASIVQQQYKLDLFDNSAFLFCGRHRNRLKLRFAAAFTKPHPLCSWKTQYAIQSSTLKYSMRKRGTQYEKVRCRAKNDGRPCAGGKEAV
jgi:transposase